MKYIKSYKTDFDTIYMSSDGEYLTGLWFSSDINEYDYDEYVEKNLDIFDETIKWLDIYFSKQIPNFTPKYKLENLTPFRKMVIDCMNDIPYGETITYKDIALKIQNKKGMSKMSCQAVGNAVGYNPICIIIPCHRVVGQNKNLTGYSGGINNKINLLKIENIDTSLFSIPK